MASLGEGGARLPMGPSFSERVDYFCHDHYQAIRAAKTAAVALAAITVIGAIFVVLGAPLAIVAPISLTLAAGAGMMAIGKEIRLSVNLAAARKEVSRTAYFSDEDLERKTALKNRDQAQGQMNEPSRSMGAGAGAGL